MVERNTYGRFVTNPNRPLAHIVRHREGNRELLTLAGLDFTVTVELTIRGLEIDATTLERALHAPLSQIVRDVT